MIKRSPKHFRYFIFPQRRCSCSPLLCFVTLLAAAMGGRLPQLGFHMYRLNKDSKSLKLDLERQSLLKEVEKYENVFLLNPSDEVKSVYSRFSGRELNLVYQYQEGFIDTKLYKAS